MKFPCTIKERFAYYMRLFWPVLCLKGIGLPCCILVTIIVTFPLQITLLSNYSLLTISALADNTLLKTTCHFLLLLVGYDTLTYRKELQLISYTCRSSTSKMPMRCTEHQDAFVWVVYLVTEKVERGKALFANVERCLGIFLQNCHSFFLIR